MEKLVRRKLSDYFINNQAGWQTISHFVNDDRFTGRSFKNEQGVRRGQHAPLLKYFVLEYAKYNKTQLGLENNELFFIYPRFQAEQKGYGRRLFGPRTWWPIWRSKREYFCYHGIPIHATLGEVHFWYWCLTNGITDFIKQNIGKILAYRNDNLAAYGFED